MKKYLFTIMIYMFTLTAQAESISNCSEVPITGAEQAICYAKWYASVISYISEHGFSYTAKKHKNKWVVKIQEKIPGQHVTKVEIREIDGSLINMESKSGT